MAFDAWSNRRSSSAAVPPESAAFSAPTRRGLLAGAAVTAGMTATGLLGAEDAQASPPSDWYNVKADFGAAGNGTTDDTASIKNAIAAAIPSGGVVYVPPGDYAISQTLDFSGISRKGLTFQGAGAGAWNASATRLLWSGGGPAITAFGDPVSNSALSGLKLRGFGIKNTAPIGAGNFTIYWDFINNSSMEDIVVTGYSSPETGSGVWVNNCPTGQITLRRVHAWYFIGSGSEGFRFGSADTSHAQDINGGNSLLEACISGYNSIGFHFKCDHMTNGVTLNALKAVANGSGSNNQYGFWFDKLFQQNVINSPHSEGYPVSFWFNGAAFNTLNSPLASFTGTPGDNSTAYYFDAGAYANTINSGYLKSQDLGVNWYSATGNVAQIAAAPGFQIQTAAITGSYAAKNVTTRMDVVASGPTSMALKTGFSDRAGYPVAAARMNGDGRVELLGTIVCSSSVANNTVCATLPGGAALYAPKRVVFFPANVCGVFGIISISTSGDVLLSTGTPGSGNITLDGITYSIR
jgi:hypothetical protein